MTRREAVLVDVFRTARTLKKRFFLSFEIVNLTKKITDGRIASDMRTQAPAFGLECRDALLEALILQQKFFGQLRTFAEELLDELIPLLLQVVRRLFARRRRMLFVVAHRLLGSPAPRTVARSA